MKKILKNLIPPALYWITFAVGFFIVLVFDLPSGYWYHALLAVMIIVNLLVAFCKCKANEMGHFGAVHSAFAVGNYSNRFDRQERIS